MLKRTLGQLITHRVMSTHKTVEVFNTQYKHIIDSFSAGFQIMPRLLEEAKTIK